MTIVTLKFPQPPNQQMLTQMARDLGAAEVSMQEEQPEWAEQLAHWKPLTPEERAEALRIIARGGNDASVTEMIRWYEEDRDDRSLPGRE